MARGILWQEILTAALPSLFHIREEIVSLVRHHSLPVNFLRRDSYKRDFFAASLFARLELLAMLAEADIKGRISSDRDDSLEKVELFRIQAEELDCYRYPKQFPSDHTRVRYFQKPDEVSPNVEYYDNTEFEVVMLAGLPGTGKDTYIQKHLPDLPMISLDAIRRKESVKPTDNQGEITNQAKELARRHLRQKQPFVWNATNITRMLRANLLQLFYDYHARVRLIYLESSWQELLRRNRARNLSDQLPENVLTRLADKLEVPDLQESHAVEYVIH